MEDPKRDELAELLSNALGCPVVRDDSIIEFRPHVTTPDLPTSFTVGGRTYDLVSFLKKEDVGSVSGDTMVARAAELKAELGEEDGQFIFKHLREVPAALRDTICMVFTKWLSPHDPRRVVCIYWCEGGWGRDAGWWYDWYSLDDDWGGHRLRLVRRVQ